MFMVPPRRFFVVVRNGLRLFRDGLQVVWAPLQITKTALGQTGGVVNFHRSSTKLR